MNAPLPSPRILFILPPAPSATLTKGGPGSGWFGPDHSGTHDPGASGASPPTLPSSAGITTLEQAQAYWRMHFAKKVMALNVHGAGRNQPIPIHVRFSDTHHAYTTDAGGRQKTGQRVFDLQRAHAMDRILRTIEHPKRRLRNFHADLLLEGKAHGHQYTVVLTWREAAQVYEFHSAHFKPIQEVERLARENDPRKNSGPLQKSEPGSGEPLPSPHSPALQTPYGVGLRPRVSPQTCRPGDVSSAGSGRTMIILPALSDLFKAYPPLEQAHTLLLWRADEPPVAALLKRMATPTGARWITVHPNGADAKGVPILIQESHAGSGVFHVIGGAGGKLNYLKLRGIKPQSEYKQQAAEKRKIQQALDKQRRERDRAAGLDASKTAEKNKIAAAHHQEEKQFVADVAKIAGWTDADLAFPHDRYAHLSPRAYQEMRARHHRERVKQAQDYIQRQAVQLLADPDHLKQALGEIPLTASDPATLSVQDLDPVKPPDRGLGFAPTYGQRAEGGKEAVRAEAAQLQQERLEAHPERKAALARRQETAAQLKQELEHQRLPAASAPPVDALPADQVMALLKRQKQLDRATKAAREARQQVDAANTLQEVKAYNLEVDGQHVEDEDVIQDVQDQLRTIQTRALLAEVAQVSEGRPPDQALERHLGAGAQAALDALNLTVAGHGLVDRSVVDVLGLEGAARTLAYRLRATLDASEMENLQQALSDYHVDHYTQRGEQAMKEAKAYQDEAAQIELEAAQTGGDLQQAQGLNRRRARALANARRVLGTCLGEFEMNAALIQALKEPSARPLEVALGKIGLESAIAQAKALGLQPGDYTLDTIGGTQFLTVRPEGLERLTQPLDAERLQRQRAALDIQQGRRDEEHWWPTGVARRPDLAAPVPPGVAPTLAEPFQPQGPDDLNRALEDYIGGRTADGDAPAAILSDVLSGPMLERAEAAGIPRSRYMAAVDALAPSRDAKGKLMRAEAHAPAFQALADRFVQHRHGGERSPLHRQDIPLDDTATEALHRALSAEPSGIAAFKAIGDLADADQRALRGFFDRHIARDDPDAAALRQTLAAHEKQEPERETVDMFGETGTNPAWQDWQNRRNELAEQLNAMTLDWPKYVRMMHGRKNAYAAMQDLIRSRVTEQFHHAYNTLHPQQPLKLGRQVIRGNLNHLDAIDPDARAARLVQERQLIDALRNRVGGKYAEGSVIEKLDSAREQREAMAQNQMGFFGAEEEPADAPPPPLKADERHTLGHVAEQRLAALMGVVGPNFKPGEPIKLWNPSLSGQDSIGRQRAIKLIEANRRVALGLGTGCVRGDTLLDDADGKNLTFAEWWITGETPTIWALTPNGAVARRQASPVFIKGQALCHEIKLSSGETIIASQDHLFLTSKGWVRCAEIVSGDYFLRPTSFLYEIQNHLQKDEDANAPTCLEAATNYQSDYLNDSYLCDVPLLQDLILGQDDFLLPSDVQAHTREHWRKDDSQISQTHNQIDKQISRIAIEEHLPQFLLQNSFFEECVADEGALELLRHLSQEIWLSDEKFSHLRHTFELYLQSLTRCFSEQTLLAQAECQHESSNFEQSLSKCQVPVLQEMCFEDASKSELQDQGKTLAALPLEKSSVVFNRVSGLYFIFDLHVPKDANYISGGMVHHNSGKSLITLGAFTHLHAQGKIRRGIFAVPSIVQGQFGAEALRYLEPGKYQWHAEPGASREERIAAIKDPKNHFVVTTHQALRDDLMKMAEMKTGELPETIVERMNSMSRADRAAFIKEVLDYHGVNFDYSSIDEGHGLLDRAGKNDSLLSILIGGITDNTPYTVSASADPTKNDVSEAFSLLQKMDPAHYTDRAAFMRRFGVDTAAAKTALQRELAPYLITGRIESGQAVHRRTETVPLSAAQRRDLESVQRRVAQMRLARMKGAVDVEAARALSPGAFAGVSTDQHTAVARQLARSLGVLRESALRRVFDAHPESGKLDAIHRLTAPGGELHGQPGVVFAHSLDAVRHIAERLERAGHRVVTLTGADSSQAKAQKKARFAPETGPAQADILVTSDAGAVGMNAQRGRWLIQHDVPQTALIHNQRNGRVDRIGQQHEVKLIDLVHDHPAEQAARDRLAKKYELREIMTAPQIGLDETGLAGYLLRRRAEQNGGASS